MNYDYKELISNIRQVSAEPHVHVGEFPHMRGFRILEVISCQFFLKAFREMLQLLLLSSQGPLMLLVDDVRDIEARILRLGGVRCAQLT